MEICFNGINDTVVSFWADSDVGEGDLVEMSSNFKVKKATDGAKFIGLCTGVRKGIASVKINGYIKYAYTSTAPALGIAFLAADDSGNIESVAAGSGRIAMVVGVNSTDKTAEFLLY